MFTPGLRPVAILILLMLACPISTITAAEETVVFRETFDSPDALTHWSGRAGNIDATAGESGALVIESDDPSRDSTRRIAIPIERLLDDAITIEVRLKAENVSTPPNHWNGIKTMLVVETDTGVVDHPQVRLPQGDIPWSTASETLRLPGNTRRVSLVLGLEKVTGRVLFDEVTIRQGRRITGTVRQGDRFKGHDLPALRGVMLGPKFDAQNIRDLAAWNVNQVRWQVNWSPMKKAETWAADLEAYDQWLEGALDQAEQAIDMCEEHGIRVLFDLHCPPGGRAEAGKCRMFMEERYQAKFLDVWHRIATRFKGCETIYAYDLINEPVEPNLLPDGLMHWPELATEATKIIRAIDPGKPVVFEPGPWGGCGGFDEMVPLDLDRVIYSFHMYQPHSFTHQFQSMDRHPDGVVYPGLIDGVSWGKAQLREAMRPALDFQREFNVHMVIGEFSAIRWAPDNSAYRYLRDLVELFEAEGWDWSYHAFREFDGWSMEHTTDQRDHQPSKTPTDRELLLRGWFEKNERAAK